MPNALVGLMETNILQRFWILRSHLVLIHGSLKNGAMVKVEEVVTNALKG